MGKNLGKHTFHLILNLIDLQALSIVYPGAFQSEEVFSQLITFLKHEDDSVCKYLCPLLQNLFLF